MKRVRGTEVACIELIKVGLVHDKGDGTDNPGSITSPEDILPWFVDIAD